MLSKLAVIETDNIGKNVTIMEFSIVRAGATIGNNVVIHPHVVIEPGVVIGDGVEVFPGSMIGKEPKRAGVMSRPLVFERRVVIGANSSVGPNAVIYYDVEIGESTMVGDGASIRERVRIGSNSLISRLVTINYNTTIGDYTKVLDTSHITGNCHVGNNVFISFGVMTANDNAIGQTAYSDEMRGPTLEDGVKVGAGAIMLPGVCIGARSIVGAGSVVTKDVEPATLVMGVPARFVRRIQE